MIKLRMKISVIFAGGKKRKVFKGSVAGVFSAVLIFLWDLIVQELSRKEYPIFPQSLKNYLRNFKIEKLSSAMATRIILTLALSFGFLLWIGNGRISIGDELGRGSKIFIPDVHGALAAETTNSSPKPPAGDKVFNGYLINTSSFSRKQCEEAQKGRKNSEFCGEDLMDEALVTELDSFDKEYQKQHAKQIVKRAVVRKVSCRDPEQKPSYSETKGKHVDEDCCPDPDEWPKPGCIYKPSDYAIMLKR